MPKPAKGYCSCKSKFTRRKRKRFDLKSPDAFNTQQSAESDAPSQSDNLVYSATGTIRKPLTVNTSCTNMLSNVVQSSPRKRLKFSENSISMPTEPHTFADPRLSFQKESSSQTGLTTICGPANSRLSVPTNSSTYRHSSSQTDFTHAEQDSIQYTDRSTQTCSPFDEQSSNLFAQPASPGKLTYSLWSDEETKVLLTGLLQLGFKTFPRGRLTSYSHKNGQYITFCCLYAIMKNMLSSFNRSFYSVYKRCSSLSENSRKELLKSGNVTPSDKAIFSACLSAHGITNNDHDHLKISFEDIWSFLVSSHYSISLTIVLLFLQVSRGDVFDPTKFVSQETNLVSSILSCLSADKVLHEEGLPNIVYNLAQTIASKQFPLKSVLFYFFEENIRFFSLENSSSMWYNRATKLLWKAAKEQYGSSVLRFFFRLEAHWPIGLIQY